MKLTKELIIKLLEESPSFREVAALELISSFTNSDVRGRVLSYLAENRQKKIECIKWLREEFSSFDIERAFPDYNHEPFASNRIGLKEAKDFVEHHFMRINP